MNCSYLSFFLLSNIIIAGLDLCASHAIDPEEFVEMLFAYTVNNSNDMKISESALDDFERKELTNYRANGTKNGSSKAQQKMIFNYDHIGSDSENDNEVMDAYICTTPKV